MRERPLPAGRNYTKWNSESEGTLAKRYLCPHLPVGAKPGYSTSGGPAGWEDTQHCGLAVSCWTPKYFCGERCTQLRRNRGAISGKPACPSSSQETGESSPRRKETCTEGHGSELVALPLLIPDMVRPTGRKFTVKLTCDWKGWEWHQKPSGQFPG